VNAGEETDPAAGRNYEVERRERLLQRPGFQITEMQIGSAQEIPWHYHTQIQDTFYVLEGGLQVSLQQPAETVQLAPGQTYSVRPGRPHRLTSAGGGSTVFLNLQGIGEYDWNPARS
jgi:mannose-6-phosphate isomerase-like protein (cupin superfamily)